MNEGQLNYVSFMGFEGPELDAIHEAYNSEDISYVARRGFAVNVGERPPQDIQLPFITISAEIMQISVRNQRKDVLRGVQLHLSETESHYAELAPGQPKEIVDAVIRYAEDAELALCAGLVHTGPIPVYALWMGEEQTKPILSELEKRMTAIKAEAKKLAEEPLEP